MKKNHQIIETAEPFFFPGGPIGCVLIHGFTGSPKEMRGMGEYLSEKKITVLGIRLAGHATNPTDMIRCRWQDWTASVEDGFYCLQDMCKVVFLCGLSMGGILSLICGTYLPVKGIVAMSTPYSLPNDFRLKFIKPLSILVPWINKGESDFKDKASEQFHIAYPQYPTRSIAELYHLTKILPHSLNKVTKPVLLINSKSDLTVPLEQSGEIEIHLKNSSAVERIVLKTSGHVITEDIEKDSVFRNTAAFIITHSKDL